MNRSAKLVWRCKTSEGLWKRFPVVTGSNGKIKTGMVLVDGKEVKMPIGCFQLRTYVGKKIVFTPAGTNAVDAQTLQNKTVVSTRVRFEAEAAGMALIPEETRLKLKTAIPAFVQRTEDAQASVAAKVYERALDDFLEATTVVYVDQITADTLLTFTAALRKKGNSERTINNKQERICCFLRWADVDVKKLGLKKVRYDRKLPHVYAKSDINAVLQSEALDHYWRIVLQLLRQTGLREREAMFLQWSDITFSTGVLRVKAKPNLGFTIKDREERDIPLPNSLLEELGGWRKEHPRSVFVIGTSRDTVNLHLLRGLKRLIKKIGLSGSWTLHGFRRSYATSLSRAGIDVVTIQRLLGHSDVKTTMGYLASMRTADIKPLIDTVSF